MKPLGAPPEPATSHYLTGGVLNLHGHSYALLQLLQYAFKRINLIFLGSSAEDLFRKYDDVYQARMC